MSEKKDKRRAMDILLVALEEALYQHQPPLPISLLMPLRKKNIHLQRRTRALREEETILPSPYTQPPELMLPPRASSDELTLCTTYIRKKSAATQKLAKSAAPWITWGHTPPRGVWSLTALGKLRRAILHLETRIAKSQRTEQELQKEAHALWALFGGRDHGETATPRLMHGFVHLQEKKDELERRQMLHFLQNHALVPFQLKAPAPVSRFPFAPKADGSRVVPLFAEAERALKQWEKSIASRNEQEALWKFHQQAVFEKTEFSHALEMSLAQLEAHPPEVLTEGQRALLFWIPTYFHQLQTLHALTWQILSLRMWTQLLLLRAGQTSPQLRYERPQQVIAQCLETWAQKFADLDWDKTQIGEAQTESQQGVLEIHIAQANQEAAASLPFHWDAVGRKSAYLLLAARARLLLWGTSCAPSGAQAVSPHPSLLE